MWQNPKLVMQSTAQCLLNPPTPPLPSSQQTQSLPTTTSSSPPCLLNHSPKLSRRDLAICTKSSILLLLGSQVQPHFLLSKAIAEEVAPPEEAKAIAEEVAPQEEAKAVAEEVAPPEEAKAIAEEVAPQEEAKAVAEEVAPPEEAKAVAEEVAPPEEADKSSNTTTTSASTDKITKKRAFFDVSIAGEPVGRIVIGLNGDNAPITTSKFSNIISGTAGISYRRKEFIKIMPNYIQHGGVRSYGVDADLAKKTGSSLANERLIAELDKANGSSPGTKNVAGSVGIIVKDPLKPPPKVKLVARKGKLEIDEEEIGKDPNGTEFVISRKDSPELDASCVVVGKVLEGMEVVERIGQVKTVQENSTSPYFRAAKLIGDKRAVVAERGFNRPYSKVIVTNCGLLD